MHDPTLQRFPREIAAYLRRTALLALLALAFVAGPVPAMAGDAAPSQRLRILVTGNLQGTLLPTWHCTGESIGGLPRRMSFVHFLRQESAEEAVPLLLIDNGAFFGRESEFQLFYAEFYAAVFNRMGYDVINLGAPELTQGDAVIDRMVQPAGFSLIGGNVRRKAADTPWRPYMVKTIGGVRVAMIGMVGPDRLAASGGVESGPPHQALRTLIEEIGDQADLVILMAQMTPFQAAALTEDIPGVDITVTGFSSDPFHDETPAGMLLMSPGSNGQFVGVLDVEVDLGRKNGTAPRADVTFFALDESLPDDPSFFDMTQALNDQIDNARAEAYALRKIIGQQKASSMVEETRNMSPEEFLKNYDHRLNRKQEQ
ncbi:hypothetical protein [Desulfatitalea alkaliphila]|uniref:2',3'-cyclic-nucleotide 2'-phosphodiesterase/5'-or 3'-nucleotidase, 5'-nucleotidase family n=1 Tax=Desulfatitalea alkaliphila TaxID=2929485 RepID=A0AA41QZR1_9BACT|nr:hypothetical protein [Desulfatitalea alkaliphila]MCJ8499387.1 hypothetical protein [Desulfatitalea alkaliphila]